VLAHEFVVLVAHRALAFPTPDGPLLSVYAERIPFRLTIGLLGYAVLFGAVIAIDYYSRLREREVTTEALRRQLAEARLETLRMQLNPHFLINTMNTIAMLVRRGDRTDAVEMLARLSDLLRQTLVESPPQESTLRGELAFIERYLDIERVRFADRLREEVDIHPSLLDSAVPTLVLQPLVENAIRHGVARRATSGLIRISGRPAGDGLELQVADDGPGFTPGLETTGIGIGNTRSRIAQLYGPEASLTYAARAGGGTIATLLIPRRVRMPKLEAVTAGAA
jgi:sensor histidine kinase YesM